MEEVITAKEKLNLSSYNYVNKKLLWLKGKKNEKDSIPFIWLNPKKKSLSNVHRVSYYKLLDILDTIEKKMIEDKIDHIFNHLKKENDSFKIFSINNEKLVKNILIFFYLIYFILFLFYLFFLNLFFILIIFLLFFIFFIFSVQNQKQHFPRFGGPTKKKSDRKFLVEFQFHNTNRKNDRNKGQI